MARKITIRPTGTCFDDTWEILETFVLRDRREFGRLFLVHSICLFRNGREYSHAWVERDGMCLFFGIVNGEKSPLALAREKFYKEYRVKECTHYTVEDAIEENIRTGYLGPWLDKYLRLCRDKQN